MKKCLAQNIFTPKDWYFCNSYAYWINSSSRSEKHCFYCYYYPLCSGLTAIVFIDRYTGERGPMCQLSWYEIRKSKIMKYEILRPSITFVFDDSKFSSCVNSRVTKKARIICVKHCIVCKQFLIGLCSCQFDRVGAQLLELISNT